MAGVRVRKGDESSGSGHFWGGGVYSPPDPSGGRYEGAGEDEVQGAVVGVEGPCNGGLLGWECHAFLESFGCGDCGAVGRGW